MVNKEISSSLVTEGLGTSFIGQNVLYHPSLPSTMDEARQEAQKGAVNGTVIITGEQTGGRGRLQRGWISPAENIALSIILYPVNKVLPYFIMIASLAVAHSIEAVTDLTTRIKWPNDILIDGKKVSGILIENEFKGNDVAFSIVGIGINVALKTEDFPEIAATATALKDETGGEVPRVEVIKNLLVEFERLYLLLPEGLSIYKAWRDRLITLGKNVVVTSGDDIIEGTAESVDESGALLLRQKDGSLTRVVAGDVTLCEK